MIKHDVYPGLKTYVEQLRGEMDSIPSNRKSDLKKISAFISAARSEIP